MKLPHLMTKNIYLTAFLSWLLFIPVPIINGLFRENFLKFYILPDTANLISTLILSALFFGYAFFVLRKLILKSNLSEVLMIGLIWVGLTIIFEFSLGILVEKQPLGKLLEDYDILKGRIWSLFLLLMLFTPWTIKLIKTTPK